MKTILAAIGSLICLFGFGYELYKCYELSYNSTDSICTIISDGKYINLGSTNHKRYGYEYKIEYNNIFNTYRTENKHPIGTKFHIRYLLKDSLTYEPINPFDKNKLNLWYFLNKKKWSLILMLSLGLILVYAVYDGIKGLTSRSS